MSGKRLKPRTHEIFVVLDTNALFTGSASNFLRREIADLMSQQVATDDWVVKWIVPDVVRHERQFQMLDAAYRLLPSVEKLERLLGHNLNITREILQTRVNEAVNRQVDEFSIEICELVSSEVDWSRLILDAAYRRPPFQSGETEKGFRDAIILETFAQVVAKAPATASVARVALVSGDQLLRQAAEIRCEHAANVLVLDSVDALKGLLNTLRSTVDEHFIENIRPRADKYFFEPDNKTTLYYKAEVASSLKRSLNEANVQLPRDATKFAVVKWTIRPPTFQKKQGQRIFWSSRCEGRLKATKPETKLPTPGLQLINDISTYRLDDVTFDLRNSGLSLTDPNQPLIFTAPPLPRNPTISTIGLGLGGGGSIWSNIGEQIVANGTAYLDVFWSLQVTTSGNLTKAKIESTGFVEAVWE